MTSLLADIGAHLQNINPANMMLPVACFMVAQFAMVPFMIRRQRAAIMKMSPEDRMKLVDHRWQKSSWLSQWSSLIFILPLFILPYFTGSLGRWLLPAFSAVFGMYLVSMFWEAVATARRSKAAGLPADYISARKRHSLFSAALMTLFMTWLIIDLGRIVIPLQQDMDERARGQIKLNQQQPVQSARESKDREIGKPPEGP